MSPIKRIEAIDPDSVQWQDWKPGGGNDGEPRIQEIYKDVLNEIDKTGAAKLTIEGIDPAFGSTINEANYWAVTLRQKFKKDNCQVGLRTITVNEEKVELNIKLK